MIVCRRLGPDDADAYIALRRLGLEEEPCDFGEDVDEFQAIAPEVLRARLEPRPESSVSLGAFDDGTLVGIVGLHRRMDRRKLWHRAELFGTYVVPQSRRHGVGSMLLRELLTLARGMEGLERIGLTVRETNVAARGLYEKVGFVVWGIEPCGLRAAGRDHNLAHMDCEVVAARTEPAC